MVAASQAPSVQVLTNQLADLQAMPQTPDVVAAIAVVSGLLTSTQGAVAATGSATLRTLANRFAEVTDVKDFGAVGDGANDDTVAIQAAITAAPSGGIVLFPPGQYKVTASITCTGKDLTLDVRGQILDRLAAWAANYADLTLNGKGVFAFTTGKIAIIGHGRVHFDGGRGAGGVSQTARNLLYFYNCSAVTVEDLQTINGLGCSVTTYLCTNVLHRACTHDQGEYPVLHSRGTDILVESVTVTNATYNAITCHNRGGFANGVLAFQAGLRIRVIDCKVFGVTSVNTFAVGITIDTCTHFTASRNTVDLNALGTIAFSWAGSSWGVVSDNRALNLSNVANGSYTYAGIGMECDTVTQVEFVRNHFNACIMGYLILAATDCSFDGNYFSDTGRAGAVSTGAGQAGYININNPGTASKRLRISGISDGGTYVIQVLGTVDELTISDMIVYDYFFRFLNVAGGALVTKLMVDNVQIVHPGNAKDVFVVADDCCKDARIMNVRAEAVTAPATSKRFWKGEANLGIFEFVNLFIANWDEAFNIDLYNRVSRETIRNCHFVGIAAGSLLTNVGAGPKVVFEGCTLAGVAIQAKGSNAAMIFTAAAPATVPVFIGQFCLDTTNFKLYVAKATGAAGDWVILN